MAREIGPYTVVRELGRGGMGVVYEVRHPEIPRALALKLILEGHADPDALARFGREAETMARVRHPNVVMVHQLGRVPEGPYIVTELVEGDSIQDRLKVAGPFAPERAAQVVERLAGAVAALHAQGVLHRDLKPDNVILRPDGSPVLLDFGVAKDVGAERLTQTGASVGTPAYASPEQAGGELGVDERTDVYGLGAVLLSMLSGRAPYEGSTLMNVVSKVLTKEPRWPSVDVPDTPAGLEAVCRRAMAKQPENRYASAAALAEALAAWQRSGDQAPARGLRLFGTAAALALALLLGVGWFATRDPKPDAADAVPEPVVTDPSGPPRSVDEGRPEEVAKDPLRERLEGARPDRPLLRLDHGGTDPVRAVFAGDTHALTWSRTAGITYWDLRSGKTLHHWTRLEGPAYCVVATDAGWAVASVGRRLLRLDLTSYAVTALHRARGSATRLALAPDRRSFAMGGESWLGRFDLEAGALTATTYEAPRGWVSALAFSRAGDRVICGSGGSIDTPNSLGIHAAESGELLLSFDPAAKIKALAVHPDGKRFAWGNNVGRIELWDLEEARSLHTFAGKDDTSIFAGAQVGSISGLAFSRDGALLYSVTGEDSQSDFDIAVWNISTGQALWTSGKLVDGISVDSMDLSPDGKLLLTGMRNKVALVWPAHDPR